MASTSSPAELAHASVLPDTAGPYCTYGSSSGNTQTCFTVNGSGLYVDNMVLRACVMNSGRTLYAEITGPSFTYFSSQSYVAPGSCLTFVVPVDKDVSGGYYYGDTWRVNSDGSSTLIGQEAINVHS